MSARVGRNDPCPCGSGLKYKKCHALKEDKPTSGEFWSRWAKPIVLSTAIFAVGVLAVAVASSAGTQPGRVWSEEHGHWHDADTDENEPPLPAALGGAPRTYQPKPQPAGPVPEGKVWSTEHGHWHNLDGGESAPEAAEGGDPKPQPPGPAPEGKVWSTEHGHWHNLDGGESAPAGAEAAPAAANGAGTESGSSGAGEDAE